MRNILNKIQLWYAQTTEVDMASVVRGMSTLAFGAGAARMIGLSSMPILARIYDPEDFGKLTIFAALVAQIVPLLTLRYAVALPLPRTEKMAMNLLALNAGLMVVAVALVTLALAGFAPSLLAWLSSEELLGYWWLIPIGAIAVAANDTLTFWAIRMRRYKVIANSQFLQSIIGESVKISLGLFGFYPLGLVLGQIATQGSGSCVLIVRFFDQFRLLCKAISWKRLVIVAKRYRDSPLFRLPSQLLNTFSNQSPLFFSAAIFGTEITGQLGLATLMLVLPVSLVGQTMSAAYYGEAVQLRRAAGKLREMTFLVTKHLLFLSLPIAVFLAFSAEWIFVFVFGSEWIVAGQFAEIMALYLVPQMVFTPLIQTLNVLEKQSSYFLINIMRTFGLLAIYYWGQGATISSHEFLLTISLFLSLFYVLASAYVLIVVHGLVRKH